MEVSSTANKEKLDNLRQQVIDTLLEIDNINLQINPRLLANYAKTIGYLENDLYKWQLKARRAKRKFALTQAAVNRNESISLDVIEHALDDEFAEWEANLTLRLNEQLQLLEAFSKSSPLSPASSRELKSLHKKLIKRLHPDLHSDLPEDAKRFFLIAQAAYEAGDLPMLRAVDTATEEYEGANTELEITESELEIEIAMAEAQLNIAIEKLDSLKSSYPYVLSELLDDPVKLTKRRTELEIEIERQREICKVFEQKVINLQKED